MSLKINSINAGCTQLGLLKIGDLFINDGTVYMMVKTPEHTTAALALLEGKVRYWDNSIQVDKVRGELTIYRAGQ